MIGCGVCCHRRPTHGPNKFMINHVGNLLQRNDDQDARVLANDQIVHASQLGRFGAGLGVLDRSHRLSKRHVDRNVVHRQLEVHYVLDDHNVSVVLLIKQPHRIRLLIGLLGDLASDCNGRIHVVIIVIATTFIKLLLVSKEQVTDDHFDNASTDNELERVRGQVHVHVQHVGVFYLAVKIGLLLDD